MSWWSVAFQALGSAFGDDGSGENRNNRQANQRLEEMRLAQQRNMLMYARQNELEDRRYNQESIARFRGPGGNNAGPREFSSTTPTPMAVPQPVQQQQQGSGRNRNRNRNQNQGLMYFT